MFFDNDQKSAAPADALKLKKILAAKAEPLTIRKPA